MNSVKSKPCVLGVVGATCTGKSRIGIALAQELNGEIVSMDSMQIYRGMDIGTAKLSQAERSGIPHHLIDIVDITTPYSAANYKEQAMDVIGNILARNHVPILVGGTGLYLDALLNNMTFKETECDERYRNELRSIALEADGDRKLFAILEKLDPQWAARLHHHDIRRVIRALEVLRHKEMQVPLQERDDTTEYHFLLYGLTLPRPVLYEQIDNRVDKMIECGLYDEVKALMKYAKPEDWAGASQAIGYKEMIDAIQGSTTYEEAIRLIKRNTRRYAKRQITWFKKYANIVWYAVDDYQTPEMIEKAILSRAKEDLNKALAISAFSEMEGESV